MRLAALAFPLLLASATLTFTPRVYAQQASDADRAAARELFNKGVELQNQQKFADALDHFERSQKVVNAPTILLHVGQCQAALGRLVEAAEAFRAAVRFQLPANPPAPFVAAQNEATTQLSTIEPRIPELKITVQPKDIPTLTVMVDDQPVNTALVGISRPTNPGTHKISASAPGYTKAERTLDLKEKQKLEVTLTLVSTGGVVYGPSTGDANTAVTVQNPNGAGSAAPAATSTAPKTPPPPVDTRSKMSIFLGPRLGLFIATGNLPSGDGTHEIKMGDVAGPGGAFGIEGAFRFARIFFFSILLEGAGFSGSSVDVANAAGTGSTKATTSAFTGLGAGKFGIITNPEGFGFYGTLGAGYRYFDVKATGSDGLGSDVTFEQGFQGIDYMLGLGMHFKAGKYVRIIPQAELMYGELSGSAPTVSGTNISSGSGSSGSGSSGGSSTTSTGSTLAGNGTFSDSSSQSSSHIMFFLGVGGYFDIDLDKPKPATPSPNTLDKQDAPTPPSAAAAGPEPTTPAPATPSK